VEQTEEGPREPHLFRANFRAPIKDSKMRESQSVAMDALHGFGSNNPSSTMICGKSGTGQQNMFVVGE